MTQSVCHVLMFYRKMIPSILLCGHSQMETLAKNGTIAFRSVLTSRLSKQDLDWADVVILGRTDNRAELLLAKKLKQAGKYLIYMMDDDLLNISEKVASAAFYRQKETVSCITEMMRLSDAIMSPSKLLLQKYAAGKTAMWMEEPALHLTHASPRKAGSPIVVGFAGSLDRVTDVEAILPRALKTVAEKYGDQVRFEFFGAVPSFAKELNAAAIPYCDSYDTYMEALAARHWDIGLAPMPDSVFHQYKHYIKYIEYAALGIVGLFSDVMPYTRLDEKGWPSIRCANTAEAWTESLSALIEDPDALCAKQKEVNRLAWEEFAPDAVAGSFVRRNPTLFSHRSGRKVSGLWMPMVKVYLLHCVLMGRLRVYGWRFPLVAVRKGINLIKKKLK